MTNLCYNSANRINNDGKVLEAPARRLTTRKGEFRMATSDITTQELETEEWRDVPGYEGLYQVSNFGRVMRLANTPKCVRERILSPAIRGRYASVSLCINGKPRGIDVHRLVMWAFVGRQGNRHVNHRNGIKTDNRLANLEYCTASENAQHAYNAGLQPSRKGSGNGYSKLTEDDVRIIRARAARGFKYGERKAFAKAMGIAENTMTDIINRKLWTHVEDGDE